MISFLMSVFQDTEDQYAANQRQDLICYQLRTLQLIFTPTQQAQTAWKRKHNYSSTESTEA